MLFTGVAFPGFGPNPFDPHAKAPCLVRIEGKKPAKLRDAVRAGAPRGPGVYGMLDPRGRLIYVGKAKNLRARLMSYFRPASRDPKAGRIVRQTRSLLWEPGPSEFAALLRELELIRRFRPGYNVQGQPGRRRFAYLVLGRKPASYFHLTREVPKGWVGLFGPLPSGRRLNEAARRLNDFFGLRDCPQTQPFRFADQPELFPITEPAGCLRYEIGTCLGPCIAAVSRRTYNRSARSAKAFLEGLDNSPLDHLEAEMKLAAGSFAFERAASIRDKINDLMWLQERLSWLQQARREFSFVYAVGPTWHLIRGGRVLASVVAPKCQRTRVRAFKAIEAVFPERGGPPTVAGDAYDHVLLVSSWFRRHPDEKSGLLNEANARDLCLPRRVIA